MITLWIAAQFTVALVMLGVGAYSDLKTHEISNKVWLVGGLVGALIAVLQYQGNFLFLGVHFLFMLAISAGLFGCWLMAPLKIGAADVKAGMALGAILSSFAFLNIFWAFVAVASYIAVRYLRNKKVGWRSIMEIETPFIPFLFAGCLATFLIVLAT